MKEILIGKRQSLPQQVIERVIVKTENIETVKIIKTIDEYKEQLLKELREEFERVSEKPRVRVDLPRTRTVSETVDVPVVDENGEPVLDENGDPTFTQETTESTENYTYTIYVDGGRINKDDFKSEWEVMAETDVTVVKDADNQFHQDVTRSEMEAIWKAIVANGRQLYQWKWGKEAEITSGTAINELQAINVLHQGETYV
jgi:hypothetical protein